MHMSKKLLAEV